MLSFQSLHSSGDRKVEEFIMSCMHTLCSGAASSSLNTLLGSEMWEAKLEKEMGADKTTSQVSSRAP